MNDKPNRRILDKPTGTLSLLAAGSRLVGDIETPGAMMLGGHVCGDGKWAQEARIRIENFAQSGAVAGSAATPSAAAPSPGSPRPSAKLVTAPPATIAAAKPAPGKSAAEHGHFVQLGAFHSKARAESEWKKLSARYPAEFKSLTPYYVAAKSRSGPVYKLRVGISSATDARGLCAKLKKHSQVCVPVTAASPGASGIGQRLT